MTFRNIVGRRLRTGVRVLRLAMKEPAKVRNPKIHTSAKFPSGCPELSLSDLRGSVYFGGGVDIRS